MKQYPQAEQKKILKKTVQPLLDWYSENARDLPWRRTKDPYCIWVSEIMLQQTRVEAVKPYYLRFIQQLPSVSHLACADEEKLLKLWEGLGYYSRVRNMQKAANVIMTDFGGAFPHRYQDILSLPGIGPYTAGAISSIAFELPVPAVDGNVLRVLSRVLENKDDIMEQAVRRHFSSLLAEIYPSSRRGDFTQSLMELGAVICIPNGAPFCDICPLNALCRARQNGTQADYPVASAEKKRKKELLTVFLLRCGNQFAVRKRKDTGLLAGLWEFPNLKGCYSEKEAADYLNSLGLQVQNITDKKQQKHIFTHVEWLMNCYLVDCSHAVKAFYWVNKDTLHKQISLPAAFQKFVKYL